VDKLRSIEAFVVTVETGSFSAAALKLEITSVMVGKHVSQLEAHLGTRLLQRTTRRQSLTDAGRRFYEDGKKLMEQLHWAEASVAGLRERPSGRLRIGAPTTLGECVIAPLAADYQLAHPDVSIELELNNQVLDLDDAGVDVAVRIGALDEDLDAVARALGQYRMVVCASPDYLARHGIPEAPADLASHRCLGHMIWSRRTAWRLANSAESILWPQETAFLSNDGRVLRHAALRGVGLLLQPRVLVADDLASGRLVSVLDAWVPQSRPIHVLYRQDRKPLPKTTSFIDFLVDRAPALLR
jgi:DNA-binding transcriptional LysR family regulator